MVKQIKKKIIPDKLPLPVILIAVATLAYSILGVFAVGYFLLYVGPFIMQTGNNHGVDPIVSSSYIPLMLFLLLTTVLNIIAAIGYLKLRSWSVYIFAGLLVFTVIEDLYAHNFRVGLQPVLYIVALIIAYKYKNRFFHK